MDRAGQPALQRFQPDAPDRRCGDPKQTRRHPACQGQQHCQQHHRQRPGPALDEQPHWRRPAQQLAAAGQQAQWRSLCAQRAERPRGRGLLLVHRLRGLSRHPGRAARQPGRLAQEAGVRGAGQCRQAGRGLAQL
ncbi:Uncharacterized protein APZ42_002350 [Daphnia magna]|uniref:Uncharacterized protein n=1 Tax=Daphnia magna TaxID=35525 RepID=A0A164IBK1_9CRUS|nr:Uncharacterized protein APZ42_002350 [Daphnia magna]